MELFNIKREATDPAWDWVSVSCVAPSVEQCLAYAEDVNVFGRRFYGLNAGFLRKPVAEALERAGLTFLERGIRLVLLDAYRPWSVTCEMWNCTPEAKKRFVANPTRGSRHNRGAAVDVTLRDLQSEELLEMPSAYDDFSEKAYSDFKGGKPEAIKNRELLKHLMIQQGFTPISIEWWHFDFPGWESLPVSDISLEELKCRTDKQGD